MYRGSTEAMEWNQKSVSEANHLECANHAAEERIETDGESSLATTCIGQLEAMKVSHAFVRISLLRTGQKLTVSWEVTRFFILLIAEIGDQQNVELCSLILEGLLHFSIWRAGGAATLKIIEKPLGTRLELWDFWWQGRVCADSAESKEEWSATRCS